MYAKIKNGVVVKYPYTEQELFEDNPGVGFPPHLTSEVLTSFDTVIVVHTGQPSIDYTQDIIESTPVFIQERNRWEQSWTISNAPETEVAQREQQRKSENAAQAKALLLETDWSENASVRNTLVTPHLTNSADFDAYRLALRTIVIDPPVNVENWPLKPQSIWA